MSGDPGRFDRWKVDLVGSFFGVLPEQATNAAVDGLEGEEDIHVVGAEAKGCKALTELSVKEEDVVAVGEEASLDDIENSFGREEEIKVEVLFEDAEEENITTTSDEVKPQQIADIDKGPVVGVETPDQISEEQSNDAVLSGEGEAKDLEIIDLPRIEKRTPMVVEIREEGQENSIKEEEVYIQTVMENMDVNDVEDVKVLLIHDEAIMGLEGSEDDEKMTLEDESNKESSLRGRENNVKTEVMEGLVKIENVENDVFCREVDSGEKKVEEWKEVLNEIIVTNPDVKKEVIDVTEESDISEADTDIIFEEMETKEVYEAATLQVKSKVSTHVAGRTGEKNESQQYDENSPEEGCAVLELCLQETESIEYEQIEYGMEEVAKVIVGVVECDVKETTKTTGENEREKFEDVEVVSEKSPSKVIDIEDSQESDEEEYDEEQELALVPRSEALEAAGMIVELMLDAVPYEGPANEVVHPGSLQEDLAIDLETDLINETDDESAAGPSPACEVKAADNDEVAAVPIDASKVAFACMDVRLKTGFPAKVVLKVKNCVSIILSGTENGELMMELGNLGSQAGLLKFYSQSRVMNNQVRKDLVFQHERDAVKFYKSTQSNRSLKTFLLTESDLGFGSAPVLSESELMYIMTNNVGEKNIMKMFDGRVELDCEGKIQFKFSSLGSLNLFLHHTGGPDDTALGMLRRSMADMKLMVLQGIHHRKSGDEVFRLDVVHPPVPTNKDRRKYDKRPNWKTGWSWDLLEKTCNFKIEDSRSRGPRISSSSRKVLIFNSKLSLYEFWAGITAKLFSEVKILDHKLKEFVSSAVKLGSSVKFEDNQDEMVQNEVLQGRRKLNEDEDNDNGEKADTRVKESETSCIEDNMAKKPGDVVSEGILKKHQLKEGYKKEIQENLMSGKVIQDEILARKALENEMKTLKLETDKLKVDLKTALTRLEMIGIEVKDKNETIASLEERLVLERKAKINLENKLSHQDMERKIQDEIARRTLENQINSPAEYDTRQDDKRNHVLRNLSGNGRRNSQVPRPVSGPPQISWTNILSLTWRCEEESGGNYVSCLWKFLRDISGSLESVFKIEEEIILKFKSSEKLDQALLNHATDEGKNFRRLDELEQRARLVPDEIWNNFSLTIVYTEENFHLQSRKQLFEEIRKANGYLRRFRDESVLVVFPTEIAFVRALVSRKLWVYHRKFLVREQFEVIGGNGEDNYFKGKVCLTESNLLSLYFQGEDDAGFAECFSTFLKNGRIVSVDLGRNDRLVITFNSLKELEECLKEYCQDNCNTLAKLIKLPVRCKLVTKNGSYSLLCPSTAVKKDFIGYQNLCRLEAQPRRISSKSKLCLVQILRNFEKQRKYPEIHFIEENFFKRGPSKPSQVVAAHVLDDSHENALVHGPPVVEGREITSDYEESVYSEAAGGLDGRH